MIGTNAIYYFEEGELAHRNGSIELDVDEQITDADDALRALHVTSGLEPGDFAVFLRSKKHFSSIGYLVSKLDPETGEGIIVSGDALEERPEIWLTDELATSLMRLTKEQWDDFGLNKLGRNVLRYLVDMPEAE